MTLQEFQSSILSNDQPDSWWVAIDGEVQDDLMTLPDISRLKEHHPLTRISLLHVSKSEEENAEWELFEKEGPAVFKVTRDTNAGIGNFKQLPAQEKKAEAVEEPEPEPIQAAPPEPEPEPAPKEPAAPAEAVANPTDRAKQFFKKQLNKNGTATPAPANGQKATAEALASNEEFLNLKEEVHMLKKELNEMRELMEDLKRPVSEARAMLEEREQFLEMSENSLFEKAQKQEVLQTELAQRADELDTRAEQLAKKEQALDKTAEVSN